MSGLPYRWRTQRNVIRDVNCMTSWIIEILNASWASFVEECLFECQYAIPNRIILPTIYVCANIGLESCDPILVVSGTCSSVAFWRNLMVLFTRIWKEEHAKSLAKGLCLCCWADEVRHWPQIKQGNPPNLSILLSGGEETNRDFPRNGEWNGKCSHCELVCRIVIYFCHGPVEVPMEVGSIEGDTPVCWVCKERMEE